MTREDIRRDVLSVLTTIAPESIRDARIAMTVVGGRIVFERER